ncbi:MAG: YihY/virulence factor BrkB family protein [Chitinophagales bacterium]
MTKSKNYLNYLWKLPVVKQILDLSKRTYVSKTEGITLYQVIRFINEERKRNSIQSRAAAIAFNVMLATFPAILFVFTIINYIPIGSFKTNFVDFIIFMVPYEAQQLVFEAINDIGDMTGKGGILSVGFILALYFAANSIRSLMHAFDKAENPNFIQREFIQNQVLSVGILLMLIGVFIATILGIVIGKTLIDAALVVWEIKSWFVQFLFWLLRISMIFLLVFNSISLIYRMGPATKNKWGYFSEGAILATLTSIVASIIFSYFVEHFGSYNFLYGSFGAIMVIMLWFYIIALIIIIGFELNVSLDAQRMENRAYETLTEAYSEYLEKVWDNKSASLNLENIQENRENQER